jgi:hypothetical protein
MPVSKGVRWFAHGSLMALAIYLGSTYLINSVVSKSAHPQETAASQVVKHPPANDARFRALFDAGNQAFRNGIYADALASYLEAERSTDQLTDDQYEALKKSRSQIAQIYETSGDNSAANGVYRALADCAIREGNALFQAKQYDAALARGQDAEQFSNHLTEGKRESLQGSVYLLGHSLAALHRYPEVVQAHQRMIEYLKASADDYDPAFGDSYTDLGYAYFEAKDWHGSEQSLASAIESFDRTLAHYSSDNDQTIIFRARFTRNWAQYNQIIAYYQEGNTDTSLSKAEDLFTEYSEKPSDPMHPLNVGYHASDFAALALQIAKETNRQEAMDLWGKRAPGGIKIVALHPPATH